MSEVAVSRKTSVQRNAAAHPIGFLQGGKVGYERAHHSLQGLETPIESLPVVAPFQGSL